jgi:predicted SnoaL-like aldol condensation-catalyzing enzyme
MERRAFLGLCAAAFGAAALPRAGAADCAADAAKVAAHKALLVRWTEEVWNQGRVELIPEMANELYVRHDPDRTWTVNHAENIERVRAARERFAPFGMLNVIDLMVGEGDLLFVMGHCVTSSEELRQKFGAVLQLYRFEDGRLAETWLALRQIGTWA